MRPDIVQEFRMKPPTNNEYKFDAATKNVSEVVETLNSYEGNDWYNDVVCQFDFWQSEDCEDVDGVDAFIFTDEDGDRVRVYWSEGYRKWTWGMNSDFLD
jgi:hypothetical protein